jgi:hypothetical protein
MRGSITTRLRLMAVQEGDRVKNLHGRLLGYCAASALADASIRQNPPDDGEGIQAARNNMA